MTRVTWPKALTFFAVVVLLGGALTFLKPMTYHNPVGHDQINGRGNGIRYGVGFSLAADYGTASVYLANGTLIDVVKIPGGHNYKESMRPFKSTYDSDSAASTVTNHSTFGMTSPQRFLGSQTFRSYLSPWLHDPEPSDPLTLSISPMLSALKTCTEAYLESPVSTARVIFQPAVPPEYRIAAQSAASSMSLKLVRIGSTGDILAMGAYGIGDNFSRPKPGQLVLTVDYSDSALTTTLNEECLGFLSVVRTLHDATLGASNHCGSRHYQENLVRALRNITTLSFEETDDDRLYRELREKFPQSFPSASQNEQEGLHSSATAYRQVTEIVLLGDRADEPRLHQALQEAFQDDEPYGTGPVASDKKITGRGTVKCDKKGVEYMHDPVFAPSRAAAYDCWESLLFPPQQDDEL
ncbi:MAG: hypothetical protein Q9227_006506 [Pyrenula ochraceoflavens]